MLRPTVTKPVEWKKQKIAFGFYLFVHENWCNEFYYYNETIISLFVVALWPIFKMIVT